MKKLFVLILAITSTGIINHASAQCTPRAPGPDAGLSPNWGCLDCVRRTETYDEVIYIQNFDNVNGIQVNSLRIDSITNLPPGISYAVNPPNRTFPGGGTGCIAVTGTTTDTVGNYKLGIYVTVDITGIGEVDGEAGEIIANLIALGFIDSANAPNFDYFARVIEPTGTCTIDDSCLTIGIRSLDQLFTKLGAQPNPFSERTTVTWTSNTDGKYTAKMFDVAGKEVFNQQMHVRIGTNNVTIERGQLPAGSYVFILTDGRKSISTKLMIRE